MQAMMATLLSSKSIYEMSNGELTYLAIVAAICGAGALFLTVKKIGGALYSPRVADREALAVSETIIEYPVPGCQNRRGVTMRRGARILSAYAGEGVREVILVAAAPEGERGLEIREIACIETGRLLPDDPASPMIFLNTVLLRNETAVHVFVDFK